MAARKRDAAKTKGRAKKTKAEKPAKSRKAEVAVVDEDGVEVVEGATTFEDVILVVTGVILLFAVVGAAMTTSDHYPTEKPVEYKVWKEEWDKDQAAARRGS